MKKEVDSSLAQNIFRILLELLIVFAGFSHLTFNRIEFQAQVPDWAPLSKDLVAVWANNRNFRVNSKDLLIFRGPRFTQKRNCLWHDTNHNEAVNKVQVNDLLF